MSLFRNILRLSVGDFLAKTLYLLTFVHLARVLGVETYGVLEFGVSLLAYFLLLGDGGMEMWATREVAQGADIKRLVAHVVPLRLLLAAGSFALLVATLPLLPDYPNLPTILLLFGLVLFAQALNLKWVFVGSEQMSQVATGLIIAQVVFSVAVFGLVRDVQDIVWAPLLRLLGDLIMALYFWRSFVRAHGWPSYTFTLRSVRTILPTALTLGTGQGLGLLSYNFDTLVLGFLAGTSAVGWYSAAYRPVTAMLAAPLTYFMGLFPALARTHSDNQVAFSRIVLRSLRLTAIVAVLVGITGSFLAEPVIDVLFGAAYENSVLPLQILSWSAALVILRGTYRQALNAARKQTLELRCAGAATALNVGLNLLLIPRYGIVGAALATVMADVLWLTLVAYYFHRHVAAVNVVAYLWQPMVAGMVMTFWFLQAQSFFWVVQASVGGIVYLGALFLMGETEVHTWAQVGFKAYKRL